MRPELDFHTLRTQIEAATWVPDFSMLYQRAGRVRMRDRLAVLGALLGTLGVLAPVALAGIFGRPAHRPAPAVLGPNPDLSGAYDPGPTVTPSISTAATAGRFPSTITPLAAAGDLPDLVAAVDVCVEVSQAHRCSLQVTRLGGTTERRTPYVLDALRESPLDKISNVQLTRIATGTYMLSGEVSGGSRSCLQFRLTGDAQAPLPAQTGSPVIGPSERLALGGGDLAVQLAQYGDLFGVRGTDGSLSLVGQPPLARRTVLNGLPAGTGWWVAGADLHTGAPAVSVSVDQGQHWTASTLDAPPGIDVPTVTTLDGRNAWAFVRYSHAVRFFRTSDGGANWREVRTPIELPASLKTLENRPFGALVRPDRSVLLWFQADAETIVLESNDGEHFGAVAGPGGAIVPVGNGYASLGDPTQVSTDAHAWREATLSAIVLPN
ncbi:sialidase family protein [Dactylosporangium sp. NPDC051484]|uniref:sialidase family protein n=1 Tax=Dactylosporangium sp. NPDC051484 TaxID=3154942 RepID=UPI00344EF33E